MNWKPVLLPELSYEAIKAYANAHKKPMCKVMQQMLFEWTLSFWLILLVMVLMFLIMMIINWISLEFDGVEERKSYR